MHLEEVAEAIHGADKFEFHVDAVHGLACRALNEMQHDCSETQQALQEVMDDPIKLQSVCLEEAAEVIHGADEDQPHVPHRPTKAMLAAASLFESYERQILTVHGAIKVHLSMAHAPKL